MKIEAGKFYRTRDGQKVGPMIADYPGFIVRRGDGQKWEADGSPVRACGMPDGFDLIAEWSDPVDLTALTTPFGLLDEVYGPGTQEALKAHGGPWEVFSHFGWGFWGGEPIHCWPEDRAIRVKPAPPQPRTIYLCEVPDGIPSIHATAIDATEAALDCSDVATVSEWREVL